MAKKKTKNKYYLEYDNKGYYDYYNEYTKYVFENEKLVCNKIKQKLLQNVRMGELFHFDVEKANAPIDWMEQNIRHFKGPLAGELIKLSHWQKWILCTIYGFVDNDNKRIINNATIVVARKNGKTTFMGGLALYELIASGQGIESAEIFFAANNKDQVKKGLYNDSYVMAKRNKQISKYVKRLKTEIVFPLTDSKIVPLVADPAGLDGLNPTMVVCDEIHEWNNQNQMDVLTSALGARDDQTLISITTAGFVRDKVYDNLYALSESFLLYDGVDDMGPYRNAFFIYEQDDKDEIDLPDLWIKANPNLGVSINIEALKSEYSKALNNPENKKNFFAKRLNIPQISHGSFLEYEDCLINPFTEDIKGSNIIIGIDMASSIDFAAVAFTTKIDGKRYAHVQFFKPQKFIEQHGYLDNEDYVKFVESGEIIATKENTVTSKHIYEYVVNDLMNNFNIQGIGIDRAMMKDFKKQIDDEYGDGYVTDIIQGAVTLSLPLARLKTDLLDKNLYFNGLLLSKNLQNLAVETNTEGKMKPTKKKSNGRIDGAAALLDAYAREIEFVAENGYEPY